MGLVLKGTERIPECELHGVHCSITPNLLMPLPSDWHGAPSVTEAPAPFERLVLSSLYIFCPFTTQTVS